MLGRAPPVNDQNQINQVAPAAPHADKETTATRGKLLQ
jgi:hypothetical protein